MATHFQLSRLWLGSAAAAFAAPLLAFGQVKAQEVPADTDGTIRCAMGHDHSLIAPHDHRTRARVRGTPNAPFGPARGGVGLEGTAPATGACACGDDASTLDILFVYSTLARNAAGGAAALRARIDDAIAANNAAWVNSQISVGTGRDRYSARVAGFQEIAYNEAAPDWLNHLERLANPSDGFLDSVIALRDAARADVVCLVIDDARFTGGAAFYALYVRDSAAVTINWRGMGSGNLTLAHELGHTHGCAHDRGNSSFALFPYAWGHWFAANNTTYGTIMSYTGANLVPRFSNPFITFAGVPIGVGLDQPLPSYNALAIREARWTIASYGSSGRIVDCDGNGIEDALDIAEGRSLDANLNCRPDQCERRVYVDASNTGPQDGLSWATAYSDLATAMIAASLECNNIAEIWVADGIYKPVRPGEDPADRFARFDLRSGLAIYGSFQGTSRPGGGETSPSQRVFGPGNVPAFPTVFSGDIGAPGIDTDNTSTIVLAENTGANAVLDGVVIERGYSDFSGAGMFITQASPTVRNCVIRGHRAFSGAAAWIDGAGSFPLFENCTFEHNTALGGGAGLVLQDGARVTLRACSLASNTAGDGGGAVAVYGGSILTLQSCALSDNGGRWGGAIAVGDSTIIAERSRFHANRATQFSGGAIDLFNASASSLTSCALTANTAADGGAGLSIGSGSSVAVINCTIAANASVNTGGGIGMFNAALTLSNSILFANTAATPAAQDKQITVFSGTRSVNRCCIQGLSGSLGGTGNIAGNPALADAPGGDVRLLAGSPCIDAGGNGLISALQTTDLLGNARRVDDPATPDSGAGTAPVVDIGAAEFAPPPACAGDFDQSGTLDPDDLSDYIACYFQSPPCARADFNADGNSDPDDLSDFIAAYFQGC